MEQNEVKEPESTPGAISILEVPKEPQQRSKLQQFLRFLLTGGFGVGLGYLLYVQVLSENLFAILLCLLIVAFFGLESYAERIFDKWADKEG